MGVLRCGVDERWARVEGAGTFVGTWMVFTDSRDLDYNSGHDGQGVFHERGPDYQHLNELKVELFLLCCANEHSWR